ncbi:MULTISPECIES: MFS transporter [unclassified Crossiella]|uniref:MFS transporter n=1 Tax=unclassified Crossiella TaxID=2620835 RepID=UPI001FFE6147|nr:MULTISPECIES: MFS transporter [unclassified Crossiella]MCK2241576.1 MFS transporter [Crossiella sp. S99.2]MCK2255552.1 MFS transporter [Crossiella sp. S99.1]
MSTYRQVLALPRVGRLLGSALLARLAGEMLSLALVLHVLAVSGSPALAGITMFAAYAPGVLLSPLAGAVLDRFGSVRAIAVDQLASALLIGAIAVLATGPGDAVALVLLAALFSLTSPLSLAGIRTLMPRLVPDNALERANALDSGAYNLVEITGPVLAGGLFALAGGQLTLVTIAVLYTGAWLLLITLPANAGRTAPATTDTGLVRSAAQGVRFVLSHPLLRALVLSYGLYQIAWGVLTVAVTTSAPDLAGLLWGLAGLGGMLGALLAGHHLRAGRERFAIILGILVSAVAAIPLIALGGTAGLVLGLMLLSFAAGPVNVGLLTLRQRRTDPAWLGRVLAVSISLNLVGHPIGSAIGGYLTAVSPMLAFTVAGIAAALGALLAWILVPRG